MKHTRMLKEISQIAGRLLFNALRFQYLKHRGLPGRPQALSLEITHKCVARCMMCNIWKIPHTVPELSNAQWLDLLSNDLFADLIELDITGGEPFLKTDFPDLLGGICRLKKTNRLASLSSVIITTNGLLTRRVLSITREMLPLLKENRLTLVLVCAMDGIGAVHDKIRNHKHAWSKVDQTLEGLLAIRESAPHLIIGLKTTILPINVGELEAIAQYARDKDLFTIISPLIITGGRYLNTEMAGDFSFSRRDMREMVRFFSKDRTSWSYHSKVLIHYLEAGFMKKPCSCGFNYFFVRSSGELFLCPLIGQSAGNITRAAVEDILTSSSAGRIRKRIGAFPQCRTCTEPGLERYSLPIQGLSYLWLLLKMGGRRFMDMHYHMGLDKYFDNRDETLPLGF